jgi:hypothetical protein
VKNNQPHIDSVTPGAAIPGGDVVIQGSGFQMGNNRPPVVRFGEAEGSLLVCADNYVVARVP